MVFATDMVVVVLALTDANQHLSPLPWTTLRNTGTIDTCGTSVPVVGITSILASHDSGSTLLTFWQMTNSVAASLPLSFSRFAASRLVA